MTFTWTTLRVTDLDRSLTFYHDLLGLPIQERFGPPDHQIVMLGPETGTKLELISGGEPLPAPPAPGLSLGFAPEDIHGLLEQVKAQGLEVRTMSPNPSLKFYFISDPDGYAIQLVENVPE